MLYSNTTFPSESNSSRLTAVISDVYLNILYSLLFCSLLIIKNKSINQKGSASFGFLGKASVELIKRFPRCVSDISALIWVMENTWGSCILLHDIYLFLHISFYITSRMTLRPEALHKTHMLSIFTAVVVWQVFHYLPSVRSVKNTPTSPRLHLGERSLRWRWRSESFFKKHVG